MISTFLWIKAKERIVGENSADLNFCKLDFNSKEFEDVILFELIQIDNPLKIYFSSFFEKTNVREHFPQ